MSINESVPISFGWTGPTSAYQGQLNIRVVDLAFKDEKTNLFVKIPENLPPLEISSLNFTERPVLKGRAVTLLGREALKETLDLTIEQIRNLTLKAGLFEDNTKMGIVIRSDREIPLTLPKKFETGKTYRLLVTSDELSLQAQLITDRVPNQILQTTEEKKLEEKPLTQNQKEIVDIMVPLFIEMISIGLGEFPKMTNVDCSKIVVEKVGVEVQKLDEEEFKVLMKMLRVAKILHFSQPEAREIETILLAGIRAIRLKGCENILRLTFQTLFNGNIPDEIEKNIISLLETFKDLSGML